MTFRAVEVLKDVDLIFHENVSSNIDQYKSRLKERLKRLSHWPANSYDELINTLDYIQATAEPLSRFYRDYISSTVKDQKINLSDFLSALTDSLQQLGIIQNYKNDEAGLVLLETFPLTLAPSNCKRSFA